VGSIERQRPYALLTCPQTRYRQTDGSSLRKRHFHTALPGYLGRRPSGGERAPLHDEIAWIDASGEEMLSLDGALESLEAIGEREVRVIELRFFLGCTNDEAAQILSVSRATVDPDLEFAKAWLHRRLTETPRGVSTLPWK